VGLPSYEYAVRWPVPLTMTASALPLAQPPRFTTSWITADRLGVRWFAPASPEFHATGLHEAEADVLGREVTLRLAGRKGGALSDACARKVSAVASLCDSFAVNWMYARLIVAPFGIASPVQRMPTV